MKIAKAIRLSVFLLPLVLAGCGGNASSSASSDGTSESSSSVSYPVATGISLDDRTISWDALEGADGYLVRIDLADVYDANATSFVLPNSIVGSFKCEIAGVFGESNGDFSDPVDLVAYLTLLPPGHLRQDASTILWDEVEMARAYCIKVDGIEHIVQTVSYQLESTSSLKAAVMAIGDGEYVLSSQYSETIDISATLKTPANISYSEGILAWDAVSGASSYLVKVEDDDEIEVTTNQANVGFDHVGVITFKVKAKGSDSRFDSAWGEKDIEIKPLKLKAPTGLSIDNGVLSFTPVEHANGYKVYFDGTYYASIDSASYSIPESVFDIANYVQVQAISSIHESSELSKELYISVKAISNEADLRAMSHDGHYVLSNDISLTSKWTPMAFNGMLDGKGHSISGISISDSSDNVGFFSSLSSAGVSNLSLSGSILFSSGIDSANIGGLAGKSESSSVENVIVKIDITCDSINGLAFVGGLVGLSSGTDFLLCSYDGDVSASNAVSGGAFGKISDAEGECTIEKASVDGSVIVTGGESSVAGGFVGYFHDSYTTIEQSVSKSAVEGPCTIGGFVGYQGCGTIIDSYASASVSSTSDSFVYEGGFSGRTEGYNNKFTRCLSLMTLSSEHTGNGIYVGSFVGVTPGGNYRNIYVNCHYDSTLSDYDRIGNPSTGRGDGIAATPTSGFAALDGFDSAVWKLSASGVSLAWEV